MLQAALCERIVFTSYDPLEVNDALIAKAGWYKQAGMYKDAVSTLERVRMYALSPDGRKEVLYQKALCCYLAGDYVPAMSYLTEMGAKISTEDVDTKSLWAGLFLTIIAPAGYIYAGAPIEGLAATALQAGALTWGVLQCIEGCWITGLAGGLIVLGSTATGSQMRVQKLIGDYNKKALDNARANAIESALLSLEPFPASSEGRREHPEL